MALIHDMPEALVGDITPRDGISGCEKYRRELRALQDMTSDLVPETRELIRGLWHEYEGGKTKEAVFVKDVDRLELLFQTLEYEKEHGINLEEFWTSTVRKITNGALAEIAVKLRDARPRGLFPAVQAQG